DADLAVIATACVDGSIARETAVALIAEEFDEALALSHGDVRMAVAEEIADHYRAGRVGRGVSLGRLAGTVAGSEKYHQLIVPFTGRRRRIQRGNRNNVEFPVAIHIGHNRALQGNRRGEGSHRRLECAVPVSGAEYQLRAVVTAFDQV